MPLTWSRIERSGVNSVLLKTETKYPFELTATSNDNYQVHQQMTSANLLNYAIEQNELRNTTPLKSTKTRYKDWSTNTNYKQFVPEIISTRTGTQAYEPMIVYTAYDNRTNPKQVKRDNDIAMSYIWSYNNTYPIVEVKNATFGEIAHTSFEYKTAEGGWNYSAQGTAGVSRTGRNYYSLSLGNITRSLSVGSYRLTYWTKSTAATVGLPGGTIQNITASPADGNGWILYQHVFKLTAAATLTLSGTVLIDELSLYPVGAQMTTYTYDPLIEVTSVSDQRSIVSTFNYDSYHRLKMVKDQDGNIIKHYVYHYKTP